MSRVQSVWAAPCAQYHATSLAREGVDAKDGDSGTRPLTMRRRAVYTVACVTAWHARTIRAHQVARQAPVAEWYTRQVEGLCPKGRGGSSPLGGTSTRVTCGATTLTHVVSFGARIGANSNGRLAQRQSIWFTPRGSQVQILCRPPLLTPESFCLNPQLAATSTAALPIGSL